MMNAIINITELYYGIYKLYLKVGSQINKERKLVGLKFMCDST